jgi:hypothetical protein
MKKMSLFEVVFGYDKNAQNSGPAVPNWDKKRSRNKKKPPPEEKATESDKEREDISNPDGWDL